MDNDPQKNLAKFGFDSKLRADEKPPKDSVIICDCGARMIRLKMRTQKCPYCGKEFKN
jgi:hypothetical protein